VGRKSMEGKKVFENPEVTSFDREELELKVVQTQEVIDSKVEQGSF
jgi:hypothetical protein